VVILRDQAEEHPLCRYGQTSPGGVQTNNRTQTELAEWHKLSLDNMTLAQKIWPYTAQTLTAILINSPHEALIQLLSAIWPFIMRLVPIQASHPECLLLIWLTSFWYQPHCTAFKHIQRTIHNWPVEFPSSPTHQYLLHLMSELKSSIQSLCLIPVSELPSIWLDLPVLTHVSLH